MKCSIYFCCLGNDHTSNKRKMIQAKALSLLGVAFRKILEAFKDYFLLNSMLVDIFSLHGVQGVEGSNPFTPTIIRLCSY